MLDNYISTITYDVNNPFPTDGDSVYNKDVDPLYCTKVGWTGEISDLFGHPNSITGMYNDTVTNPKVLYIAFARTLYLHSVGIGCNLAGKSFSNIKLEFIGSDGTVRGTYDDSANTTKYGTRLYSFSPSACIGIKISVCTANTDIGISNITIQKETSTTTRVQALNPDGILTDIGATDGASLKCALHDDLGFVGLNTPQNEIRTMEPVRLVGAGFEGTTVDSNFWLSGASGLGAAISQANAELVINSGTATGATVYLYSVRKARYVSGTSLRYRSAQQISAGIANNKRRWGVGYGASMPTITDGAFFQIDGTEFSVVTVKGGSESKVTSFNGYHGTTYTPTTNITAYEIYWTNSKVWFVIDGVLLHVVTASSTTWSATMSFHIFADSLNSGDIAQTQTLNTRSATIFRMGKYETQPIYYHLTGNAATHVLKLGAGVLHKIVYNNTSGTSIKIVDNVTGTTPVVGIITTASGALGVWNYGIAFNTGLILITVGNGLDATIVYE